MNKSGTLGKPAARASVASDLEPSRLTPYDHKREMILALLPLSHRLGKNLAKVFFTPYV
jgi:hypothetical protein